MRFGIRPELDFEVREKLPPGFVVLSKFIYPLSLASISALVTWGHTSKSTSYVTMQPHDVPVVKHK